MFVFFVSVKKSFVLFVVTIRLLSLEIKQHVQLDVYRLECHPNICYRSSGTHSCTCNSDTRERSASFTEPGHRIHHERNRTAASTAAVFERNVRETSAVQSKLPAVIRLNIT